MSATRRPKPKPLTKAGGFFLFVEAFQKRVFVYVLLVLVPFRINEWVGSLADSGVLRLHVVHARMGAERHIARQRPQHLEAPLILAGHVGDILVIYQDEAWIHADAADDHDVVAFPALLRLRRPGGAAARVAGREMRH